MDDDVLEMWPAETIGAPVGAAPVETRGRRDAAPSRLVRAWNAWKANPLLWKSVALAVTTLAFVPVLLWPHPMASVRYLAFLLAVHVAGAVVLAWGRPWKTWTRRDWVGRMVALVILTALLSWAAKGLSGGAEDPWFWGSLITIWALHTLGAVLLHVQGKDATACPFLPGPNPS